MENVELIVPKNRFEAILDVMAHCWEQNLPNTYDTLLTAFVIPEAREQAAVFVG